MRPFYFAVFLVVLCGTTIHAQEKLNPLTTPSSPAANILNIKPGTVLRPKSYQSLEAAMFSNFMGKDGGLAIPDDFSLEVSPYWFKNHKLSLEDYLFPSDIGKQIVRTSSFSLASTQNFFLGDSTKTNSLSFGYRTSLFLGGSKDKNKIAQLKKDLNSSQSLYATIIAEVAKVFSGAGTSLPKQSFLQKINSPITQALKSINVSEEIAEEFITKLETAINNAPPGDLKLAAAADITAQTFDDFFKATPALEVFEKYIVNRTGFYLDVAYANFLNFPTNNFEYSFVPRQSLWLTPSYRFSGNLNKFQLIGVFRYQWNNTKYFEKYFPGAGYYKNNWDYGVALNGDFNRLSLQLELVGRKANTEVAAGMDDDGNPLYRKDKAADVQYMGTISYRLMDQIVLTYNLGRDFKILSNDNTLISLLSLNFGFGAPTKKNLSDVK